jgi:type VI secretion system protein ImpH
MDLEKLQREPWAFDFFEVLRWFEQEHSDKPRIGDSAARDEEILFLGQDPFVEFPAGNLSGLARDKRGRYRLFARFLGLLGPQGALPLHTTFEARLFLDSGDDAFPRFLDLFNHRFQQLFFRAWSDARPTGQFVRADDDHFAEYVGSAAGIGSDPFRRRDTVRDVAKLSLAGLLGSAVKSASRVEGMLQHVFAVDAEVEQLVGSWLKLETADQSSVGSFNASLGQDTMVGASVYSVQHKFRIRLKVRDLAQFEAFLPAGRHFNELVDLVFFYLGDLLEYEVKLLLPAECAEPVQLGSFGKLGWTTWMRDASVPWSGEVLDDCSFHPAERAAELRQRQAEMAT